MSKNNLSIRPRSSWKLRIPPEKVFEILNDSKNKMNPQLKINVVSDYIFFKIKKPLPFLVS